MTQWMNNNGWKILTAIMVGLMAWSALKNDVDKWMKPAITANAEAIEAVEEEVTAVEKDIIGVKGSIDRNTESVNALKVQQKTYHEDEQVLRKERDKVLADILTAVEKRNDSP